MYKSVKAVIKHSMRNCTFTTTIYGTVKIERFTFVIVRLKAARLVNCTILGGSVFQIFAVLLIKRYLSTSLWDTNCVTSFKLKPNPRACDVEGRRNIRRTEQLMTYQVFFGKPRWRASWTAPPPSPPRCRHSTGPDAATHHSASKSAPDAAFRHQRRPRSRYHWISWQCPRAYPVLIFLQSQHSSEFSLCTLPSFTDNRQGLAGQGKK